MTISPFDMPTPASVATPPQLPEVSVPAHASVRRGRLVPETIRYSVVIACYQSAHYICHAVDSVLSQRRLDVEVIVIDDGSTDSPDFALGRQLDMTVFCRQSNTGLSGARNTGLALSRGQYFVPLDADDHLEAGFFDALDACLARTSQPEAITVDTRLVGNHPHAGKLESALKNYDGVDPDRLDILAMKVPSVGRAVLRRDAFLAIGGYDVEMRWVEDWDMVLRMLAHGARFAACMDAVYGYMQHGPVAASGRGTRNAAWGLQVFGRALKWSIWSAAERAEIARHVETARLKHAYHSLGDAIKQADYDLARPLLDDEKAVRCHDRKERLFLRTIRILPAPIARLDFKPAARMLNVIEELQS